MELTKEQIRQLSSIIQLSDVKEYINNHLKEYEEFLKNNENICS
jgi:hypothetical protein